MRNPSNELAEVINFSIFRRFGYVIKWKDWTSEVVQTDEYVERWHEFWKWIVKTFPKLAYTLVIYKDGYGNVRNNRE